MAFKDRIVQYPGRVKLIDPDTSVEIVRDIVRDEGIVTEAGTLLNAANLTANVNELISAGIAHIGDNAGGRKSGTYSLSSGTSFVTVPSSNLTRLALTSGTWIIYGHAIYANNATGRRALRIYDVTTSASIGWSSINQSAINGTTTNMLTFAVISLTASNTFTLQVAQNSGSTLNVDLQIGAVRIA